jgi:hypothetical protein
MAAEIPLHAVRICATIKVAISIKKERYTDETGKDLLGILQGMV